MPASYVIYGRVSTRKQGASGLGLEAQQAACEAHVRSAAGVIVGIYIEQESGAVNERPQLMLALAHARRTRGVLLVSKLDRLSRDAEFLHKLHKQHQRGAIRIEVVGIPEFNTMTVGMLATFAQYEREQAKARTQAAAAACRARGRPMGNPQRLEAMGGRRDPSKGARATNSAAAERAQEWAEDHRPVVFGLLANGHQTLRQLAAGLERENCKMPRGGSQWSAAAVSRLLLRLGVETRPSAT